MKRGATMLHGGLAALFLTMLPFVRAAVPDDVFARIPVQDGGRVMPMDSYARHTLLQFSGRSTFSNAPASRWLARVLFTPEQAENDPVFLVNDTSIIEGIVSNPAPRGRFSFDQLRPGIEDLRTQTERIAQIEESERTPQQKETARLYQNLLGYFALSHAFSFTDPERGIRITNEAVRTRMQLKGDGDRFSVLDVFLRAQSLADDMQAMM